MEISFTCLDGENHLAFVSLNILEYSSYSNILDFLGITWQYWPLNILEYS